MTSLVRVALGDRGYDIHIGGGLLARAGELLAPLARGAVAVVTDENVARLHLEALLQSLRGRGIDARPLVLPSGEETKSFAWLEKLCRELLGLGVERSGLVLALGGGVIGDLAGFAAGILKRGVAFAQVPTTLLAQVDSSVGGKTAIDVPEGKNLIGLFHQPKSVLVDTSVLSTLPGRELLAGYAEVVKYAALGDADFFSWLEMNGTKALAGDPAALTHMIAHCCRMKADIVARDERESGERALLNLGHTFGHALEAVTGFSGTLLHGEAVAIGMVLAFRLSEQLGYAPPADRQRLIAHLQGAGLPVRIGDIRSERPSPETLLEFMQHDKKAERGKLKFVLVRGLGNAFVSGDVSLDAVRAVLAE
ncbi:MAG: 3-dehydroquinate synthase [Alphaproteobacteria bacterium]|nr:3-dehydroquinate synthase [Alphaproteobacteria bacterium]MBV9062757.1 3-dehydroquinate synthase [Alphaproteobacteria bacterium]